MAHSKREIKPGRARTKVAGDDEMLRTGFYDGTPLEGGKIADSQPVDLFAAAHRVAEADPYSQQKEQQADEGTTTNKKNVVAESEPVDLAASARGVAEANPAAATATEQQPGRRQGVAEPPAGGRRLGVGRPAY
ncbi:SEED MATURATION PROTEIN 1-like [Miscanthus floridulus]|uniref:SEED MATURATION PROTEIN 1-like n=1 Tax=Miscanthus floridulus TaxID=154761 RepID=UPI00345A03D7